MQHMASTASENPGAALTSCQGGHTQSQTSDAFWLPKLPCHFHEVTSHQGACCQQELEPAARRSVPEVIEPAAPAESHPAAAGAANDTDVTRRRGGRRVAAAFESLDALDAALRQVSQQSHSGNCEV
jgi:hypothetical protein